MIKTTVVGSYPVPMWLRVVSNREGLRDAILAVIKTQELAGIDVVADGELNRWDINHAETNGMIDYFVRPMSGIESDLTWEQLAAWRGGGGMSFRAKPPGIVTGPVGSGTLNLRADYDLYRDLTTRPKKFTVTSPYMLAKTLADQQYGDIEQLVLAIAEVLRQQVAEVDAEIIQVDEANVTGHPDRTPLLPRPASTASSRACREKRPCTCVTATMAGRRSSPGAYEKLIAFLNDLQADHLVLEMARRPEHELGLLKDVRPSLGLGIGVIDIKDNEVESPATVARRIEQVGRGTGGRAHSVRPPGLRLLDAPPQCRGRQDAGSCGGPGSVCRRLSKLSRAGSI